MDAPRIARGFDDWRRVGFAVIYPASRCGILFATGPDGIRGSAPSQSIELEARTLPRVWPNPVTLFCHHIIITLAIEFLASCTMRWSERSGRFPRGSALPRRPGPSCWPWQRGRRWWAGVQASSLAIPSARVFCAGTSVDPRGPHEPGDDGDSHRRVWINAFSFAPTRTRRLHRCPLCLDAQVLFAGRDAEVGDGGGHGMCPAINPITVSHPTTSTARRMVRHKPVAERGERGRDGRQRACPC
jgi:hypothetical protein